MGREINECYENQQDKLSKVVNRKRATRLVRGTDRLTQTSIDKNDIIHEATLLYNQASTAGGWEILRHEIANFLYRA